MKWMFVATMALASVARAGELTAEQIVQRSLERNAFGFENAVAKLRLTISGKGPDRVRDIDIRSKTADGRGRSLVRFLTPADVAGTAFLVVENDGRDDDQYLYLPALGKVKRIGGAQRNQKFMGTDLTYADMESRNLRRARSSRLADAVVGSNPAYVIESVPKNPDESQYGKTITWVHQVSFVPLKVEFYDKQQQLLKTLTVQRLEQRDGAYVVVESTVESVAGTRTRFQLLELDTQATLPDEQFTERALTSG